MNIIETYKLGGFRIEKGSFIQTAEKIIADEDRFCKINASTGRAF